jgi:trans-aconitate methyltransferase
MERIYLTLADLEQMERQQILLRHIERYGMLRQFLFGRVLDCACGVGYGTYLASKNPDVESIVGVDLDEAAIQWANENFKTPKTEFVASSIENFTPRPFDMLVTIETVEHLEDPTLLHKLALDCQVSEVIASFPTKKTTHYNPYHLYDMRSVDIEDIFSSFRILRTYQVHNEYELVHLVKGPESKHKPVRWGQRG